MSYSATATVASSRIVASQFMPAGSLNKTITIQNLGTNPLFINVNGAIATTTDTVLPTQYSSWQFQNEGVSSLAFITTGGNSVYSVQTV